MSMNPDVIEPEELQSITEEQLKELGDQALLVAHNFQQVPIGHKFGDNRFKDTATQYYCWRGITEIKPTSGTGMILAEACDPISYTDARTRFCLTFGCPDPFRYVRPPEGDATVVKNKRGGITVYNHKEECTGGAGFLKCLAGGVKESMSQVVLPENKTRNIVSLGGLLVALMVIAVLVKKKKIKLFKKR